MNIRDFTTSVIEKADDFNILFLRIVYNKENGYHILLCEFDGNSSATEKLSDTNVGELEKCISYLVYYFTKVHPVHKYHYHESEGMVSLSKPLENHQHESDFYFSVEWSSDWSHIVYFKVINRNTGLLAHIIRIDAMANTNTIVDKNGECKDEYANMMVSFLNWYLENISKSENFVRLFHSDDFELFYEMMDSLVNSFSK